MLNETQEKWIAHVLKAALFLAVFIFVMLLILFNLGGNSDTLKTAIEDFTSQATGYQTEIHNFHHMRFYPDISFDLENVEMRGRVDTAIEIDKLQMAMGFTDVIFHSGKIRVFHLEGLKAWPDTIVNPAFYMERFGIFLNEETGESVLAGYGSIDRTFFSFDMDLEQTGEGAKAKFGFPPDPGFSLSLGDAKVTGILASTAERLQIKNLQIADTQPIASGTMALQENVLSGRLDIQAFDKLIGILRQNEKLFFPGDETWAVPDLDMSLKVDGQETPLKWTGENCETQPTVLQPLLTLPGFDCTPGPL